MADQKLLDTEVTFSSFDLDARLVRALAKLKFTSPTLVQAKAIPLALKGVDILARARTGSGKTAAYSLPVIQNVLQLKEAFNDTDEARQAIRALILVPTRELAEQVTDNIKKLLLYCSQDIKVANIAGNIAPQFQKPILAELPDIVVATPSKALAHLEAQNMVLKMSLENLVIDEADLVLSFGYSDDVRKILTYLPKIHRSFLMSATLTKDVDELKQLILRKPAILKLEEEENEADNLVQYSVKHREKFLLTFVVLKLRLIRGKIIMFVNDIERCYKLKLFLEQFSIKTCVLNSELPLNSRYHIVQEFNKGIYDYLIATDESELKGEQDTDDEGEDMEDDTNEATDSRLGIYHRERRGRGTMDSQMLFGTLQPNQKMDNEVNTKKNASKKNKKTKRVVKDKEYGVSRGVDFQNVAAVINFDFPTSAKAYTHRIGRTARGGQRGMSLSFVVPKDVAEENRERDRTLSRPSTVDDGKVLARVEKEQSNRGVTIKPYNFDKKQVDGFRYRLEDALRAVTGVAVREARVKELKNEILNSEKLKAHFEDKPKDLEFLRHDRPLHPTRVQQHLKHIPQYLMPKIAPPTSATTGTAVADIEPELPAHQVPFKKVDNKKRARQYAANKVSRE
ncbi:P-loop containing nucleoside triphosphate hydrolase protein [Umbelopsis sp. PMI_123]|nr:P-loop containing nucleoside triphosphate hydrolase protein [Umbelopsis sp. PMI_123]